MGQASPVKIQNDPNTGYQTKQGLSNSNYLNQSSSYFNVDSTARTKDCNYYIYLSYAIFALIFIVVFLWVDTIRTMFNKAFTINVDRKLRSLSLDDNLFEAANQDDGFLFGNGDGQPSWASILANLIFTILLTIIVIILIIKFHPTLSSADDKEVGHVEPLAGG